MTTEASVVTASFRMPESSVSKNSHRRRRRQRAQSWGGDRPGNKSLLHYFCILWLLLQYFGILPSSTALSLSRISTTFGRTKSGSSHTRNSIWQHSRGGGAIIKQQQQRDRERRAATILRMVLTTPESIIEQASTEKLIDILIDESVRTSARRPIMMQFDPSSGWIWRRWKGTVFSETWISCVRNVVYALIVLYMYKATPQLQRQLNGFNTLWGQLLSVTTFTLTFFVNQSYSLWRKCYELSRRLQGRLNDLNLSLAGSAARKQPSSPSEPSTYTSASRQLLDLVSRYVRLFNLLTYASFTRSHRPILTPRGMRRLVERGLLTPQEREILIDAEIPATQRHNCILMWITRVFLEGRAAGHFIGGSGIEQQFMEKIHVIRAQYGAIGDELQGRMPLAYAHIVQVLVDCVLLMYPLMAFSSGMSPFLGVVGTGLLTTSYQGLFDLAKQFLDPYDNENYGKGEDPLCVDTLIAETNAGSLRWMYGFDQMPVSAQRIKDGELFDYLLPVRGFSVEELEKMELERIQKEKELKEKREREERERLKAEEEARRVEKEEEENAEEEIKAINGDEEGIETFGGDVEPGQSRKKAVQKHKSNATLSDPKNTPKKSANATPSLANKFSNDSSPALDQKTNATTTSPTSKRTTHSITSLEGGIPISFSESPVEDTPINASQSNIPIISVPEPEPLVTNGEVPSNNTEATSNNTEATPYDVEPSEAANDTRVESSRDDGDSQGDDKTQQQTEEEEDYDEDDEDDDMYVEFPSFQDLPWFDEVGPDGQEIRLSQLLADEEWEEEKEHREEQERMSYEEFRKRSAEIVEAAENELLETEQILMASPGAHDDESYLKEERNVKRPMYDQTKLDGISQLWGLPPEDPDDLPGYEIPDAPVEDSNFDGISQLWGRSPEGPSADEQSSRINDESSFDGISQLWGDMIDDEGSGPRDSSLPEESKYESSTDQMRQDSDDGYGELDEDIDDDELEAGYESVGLWYDDGSGDRLSQVLADEVWEDEVVEEPPELDWEAPITSLEEYEKKVVELSNEIKETEAILNAPPGADSLERDDEEEQPNHQASDETETSTPADEWTEDADDLDALEMDVSPVEEELPTNTSALANSDVTTAEAKEAVNEITNSTKTDESVSEDTTIGDSKNGDNKEENQSED